MNDSKDNLNTETVIVMSLKRSLVFTFNDFKKLFGKITPDLVHSPEDAESPVVEIVIMRNGQEFDNGTIQFDGEKPIYLLPNLLASKAVKNKGIKKLRVLSPIFFELEDQIIFRTASPSTLRERVEYLPERGTTMKCTNTKPLGNNEFGPPLSEDSYNLNDACFDSQGNPHFDIGLKSQLKFVSSYETGEHLPDGDVVHWCHPSRFDIPIS